MLKLLSKIIRSIASILLRIDKKFLSTPAVLPTPAVSNQAVRVIPWFKDNGDKTHRMNYALDESSIVFDLGGYEGQWASDIFGRYLSTIHIFEPYVKYAENIENRFRKNSKIKIHRFGLAQNSDSLKLSISDDASSLFKIAADSTDVQMIEASDFFANNDIEKIDLMKINIEGGEYDLLDHLIEKGLVSKITDIQVQFHDFVEDAENRMRNIQSKLSDTHFLTYQYEFVWENWSRKQ